jgi:UDP-glucose 4-epimerase
MRQKALVTGGAGFIGSHLTRDLLARGLEVVVLDDLSMGKQENLPTDAQLIVGDVCSPDDVRKALEGVDVVFHEAARVSVRSSIKQFYDDAEINFMGTLNLLQCCANSSVRRIVFASSMAVYADSEYPEPITEEYKAEPISPYGIAKLAAEKYCLQLARDMDIDCHVLRYFNTYGVGQSITPYVGVITIFIERLLAGKPPVIFGDGEQRRDFVHVSDIVAANILAMDSEERYGLFNVGTGRATSVKEIAAMLCEKIAPDIAAEYVAAHPGELRYSIADIGRISEILGYSPQVSITERLDEIIDSYREKLPE